MSTHHDPDAGRAAGESAKHNMTALVRRYRPVLVRRVQRALVSYLMEHQRATTDDIRDCVNPPAGVGTSFWGAAANGLAQAHLIRRVAFTVSSRPERHGCYIGVWTLAVSHDDARRWLATHPDLPDPDPADGPDPAAAPNPTPPRPTPPCGTPTFTQTMFC
jgi:hypothetical protein